MKGFFKGFKGIKRIFSAFLVLIFTSMLCLSMLGESSEKSFRAFAVDVWDGSTASNFSSGNGTAALPYIISTAAELKYFADTVTGGTTFSGNYIELASDIDLNSMKWTPIGYSSTNSWNSTTVAFAGHFNGNNHVVSNINIDIKVESTGTFYPAGFFGKINNATVSNLILNIISVIFSSVNVENKQASGGCLAGVAFNSHISGCGVINGTVDNQIETIGGTVTLSAYGGLVGDFVGLSDYTTGSITDCFVYADVSSATLAGNTQNFVGGIVGRIRRLDSYPGNLPHKCYYSGNVTGSAYTGPLIGGWRGTSNNIYCYIAAATSTSPTYTTNNDIASYYANSVKINNNTIGSSPDYFGVGSAAASAVTLLNQNSTDNWKLLSVSGNDYPVLIAFDVNSLLGVKIESESIEYTANTSTVPFSLAPQFEWELDEVFLSNNNSVIVPVKLIESLLSVEASWNYSVDGTPVSYLSTDSISIGSSALSAVIIASPTALGVDFTAQVINGSDDFTYAYSWEDENSVSFGTNATISLSEANDSGKTLTVTVIISYDGESIVRTASRIYGNTIFLCESGAHGSDGIDYAAGNDLNDGKTPQTAVATLERAYGLFESGSVVSENYIVIMGAYSFSTEHPWTSIAGNATLTGEYYNIDYSGQFVSSGSNEIFLLLTGETVFENLTFSSQNNSALYINAQGHDLTMGDNLAMIVTSNTSTTSEQGYPANPNGGTNYIPMVHIIGATQYTSGVGNVNSLLAPTSAADPCEITIKSGIYARVLGGGRSYGSKLTRGIVVGSESTPFYTKINIDIADSAANRAASEVAGHRATYDIALLCGGQTDGSIYSDSIINISGGLLGRVIGGSIGYGRKGGNVFAGSTEINMSGGEVYELYGGSIGRQGESNYYSYHFGEIELNLSGGEVFSNVYGGCIAAYIGVTENASGDNWPASFSEATLFAAACPSGIAINISDGFVLDGNLYGGGYGHVPVSYTVNLPQDAAKAVLVNGINITMTGGTVLGNIYGGGMGYDIAQKPNLAQVEGDISVNITGGSLYALFGGGEGVAAYPQMAKVTGSVTVSVSGTAQISDGADIFGGGENGEVVGDITVNCSVSRFTNADNPADTPEIYGGGFGETASVTGDTVVNITAGEYAGSIFGGGSNGSVIGNTSVTLMGTNLIRPVSKRYIFGGGKNGNVSGSSSVSLEYALVEKTVLGGGYNGNVGSGTEVTVGENAAVLNCVFGGGYYGNVNGDTSVIFNGVQGDTDNPQNLLINSPQIGSSILCAVYGGGVGGGDGSGEVIGNTSITLNSATVVGFVFGGGFDGYVSGETLITAENTLIYNSIFGGGYSGSIGNGTRITIGSETVIEHCVFGGGFIGDITGDILINSAGAVNGGLQTPSPITQSTIFGGIYGGCFGGLVEGSVIGNVEGNVTVNVVGTPEKRAHVESFVSGAGYIGSIDGNISISVDYADIHYGVFGGGVQSPVIGDITIETGENSVIDECVFGAGYDGSVTGDISLTIAGILDGTASVNPGNPMENAILGAFGGGVKCAVTGSTEVTVLPSATIAGGVFGGGYGASAFVSGNTTVTVNGSLTGTSVGFTNPYSGIPFSAVCGVYGGGFEGRVGGNTLLIVGGTEGNHAVIGGNVVGGGYSGDIVGSTSVHINNYSEIGANVQYDIDGDGDSENLGDVYGGGYNGIVGTQETPTGSVVYLNGADITIRGSIFGGGIISPIYGNTHIMIWDNATAKSIYGGGNMGNIFGNTSVEILSCNISGEIYGGSNQSHIYGSTVVNIGAAAINSYMDETGNTGDRVLILDDNCIFLGGTVYGGGNKTSQSEVYDASEPYVTGTSLVNINAAPVGGKSYVSSVISGSVFGDGNTCVVRGTKTIEISNVGTSVNFDKLDSIQRVDYLKIKDSFLEIKGISDSANILKTAPYSLNRIGKLTLIDSNLKLLNNVNLLKEYESVLPDETTPVSRQDLISSLSNNAIYIDQGKCLTICKTENTSSPIYGTITGVTGLGVFSSDGGEIVSGVYVLGDWTTVDDENYLSTGDALIVDKYENHGFIASSSYPNDNLTTNDYIPTQTDSSTYRLWWLGTNITERTVELKASSAQSGGYAEIEAIISDGSAHILSIDTLSFEKADSSLNDFTFLQTGSALDLNDGYTMILKMMTGSVGWVESDTACSIFGTTYSAPTAAQLAQMQIGGTILEDNSSPPTIAFSLASCNDYLMLYGEAATVSFNINVCLVLPDGTALKTGIIQTQININWDYQLSFSIGYADYGKKYDEVRYSYDTGIAKAGVQITDDSSASVHFSRQYIASPNTLGSQLLSFYSVDGALSQTPFTIPQGVKILMIDDYHGDYPEYYYYIVPEGGLTEISLSQFIRCGTQNENYIPHAHLLEINSTEYTEESFFFVFDFIDAQLDDSTQNLRTCLSTFDSGGNYFSFDDGGLNSDCAVTASGFGIVVDNTEASFTAAILPSTVNSHSSLNVSGSIIITSSEAYDTKMENEQLGLLAELLISDGNGSWVSADFPQGATLNYSGTDFIPTGSYCPILLSGRIMSLGNTSFTLRQGDCAGLAPGNYMLKLTLFHSAFPLAVTPANTASLFNNISEVSLDFTVIESNYAIRAQADDEERMIYSNGVNLSGTSTLVCELEMLMSENAEAPFAEMKLYRKNLLGEYIECDSSALFDNAPLFDFASSAEIEYSLASQIDAGTYRMLFVLIDSTGEEILASHPLNIIVASAP